MRIIAVHGLDVSGAVDVGDEPDHGADYSRFVVETERDVETLQQYVPRAAAEWPDTAATHQVVDGTLCFVDISGFTNLSERLARRGRIGAEELTAVLNRVFGTMLDLAYARGGRLLKFGGDALLVLFGDGDHPVQAASAAVEMRAALRESAQIATSVGRVPLKMSVGLHSGDIHLFRGGSSHHELIVTGPGPTKTTEMEGTAEAGEIVISAALRKRLPRGAADSRKGSGYLLSWRQGRADPLGITHRLPIDLKDLIACVPLALREHLAASVQESEHRHANIGFVKFKGVDALMAEEGSEAVAEALDALMSTVQDAVDGEGVTFLATDIDADGGKVILATGVPVTQEDDEGRILRAARQIADADLRLARRIGVNRGHVFAGAIGTPFRATYTVMGDTVNLAARLMAAAGNGEVYVSPSVTSRSRTLFSTEELEPFTVKGKTELVHALALGAELGAREDSLRRELPFIGREADVAQLAEVVADGLDGQSAVALAVGEAGMGKTRLIAEVIDGLDDAAMFVVRAEPYGVADPYRAFRDTLRGILGIERSDQNVMTARLLETIQEVAPHLLPLAPLLGDATHIDVPSTPEVDAISPEFRRNRVADVVIEVLGLVLPDRVVVLIEDAQWMDEASAILLDRLAESTAARPWAMVVTRRDETGGYAPEGAVEVKLGPLGEDDIRQMTIEATTANPLRPDQIDTVVARAAGSPLFLEELLRLVRGPGELTDLPDSLDAVISAQIDALTPDARTVVRYAAVLGRSFREVVLERVLESEEFRLNETDHANLEDFFDLDGDRLRFRHSLMRDVAYEGLSYQRRRALHLRAGKIIEELAGTDLESIATALALHYSMAGEHERTWQHALTAADRAERAHATIEAVTNYERALEAARRLQQIDDQTKADVWVRLGDVRQLCGMLDESLDAYRRASTLVGDDHLARAAVTLKRARARERVGAFPSALRELARADRLLDEGQDANSAAKLRAQLTAFRAMIRWGQERPQLALEVAAEATQQARRAGETEALAQSLMVHDLADLALGGPGEGTNLREALALFQQVGDLPREAQARGNLGFIAAHAGEWNEAVEWFVSCRDVYERIGDVVGASLAGLNLGEMLTNQRRFDDAKPVLQDARRVMQAAGFTDGAEYAAVQLARVLIEDGDLAEAHRLLAAAEATFLSLGQNSSALEAAMVLADCLTRADDAMGALQRLDNAAARTDAEDIDHFACSVGLARARALTSLDRLGEARAILDHGIALAHERGMPYEEALLRLAAAELIELVGGVDPEKDRHAAMLAELGVIAAD